MTWWHLCAIDFCAYRPKRDINDHKWLVSNEVSVSTRCWYYQQTFLYSYMKQGQGNQHLRRVFLSMQHPGFVRPCTVGLSINIPWPDSYMSVSLAVCIQGRRDTLLRTVRGSISWWMQCTKKVEVPKTDKRRGRWPQTGVNKSFKKILKTSLEKMSIYSIW